MEIEKTASEKNRPQSIDGNDIEMIIEESETSERKSGKFKQKFHDYILCALLVRDCKSLE